MSQALRIRLDYLRRLPRRVRYCLRPGRASGLTRRRRLKYVLNETACALLTARRCWWGKPYSKRGETEPALRRQRCRICKRSKYADQKAWERFIATLPPPDPAITLVRPSDADMKRAEELAREMGWP